jgi:formylglycine-generating enzyme required for sulfatase activity
VGSFKANAFGLNDMNGNALQWCQDWYEYYEKGAVTDPTGADSGSFRRVLRGGAWESDSMECRSASRGSISPSMYYSYFGFRLAMDAK